MFRIKFQRLHPIRLGLNRVVGLRGINAEEVFDLWVCRSPFARSLEMLSRIIWLVVPQRFQSLAHFLLSSGSQRIKSHGLSSRFRLQWLQIQGDCYGARARDFESFCGGLIARGNDLNRKFAVGYPFEFHETRFSRILPVKLATCAKQGHNHRVVYWRPIWSLHVNLCIRRGVLHLHTIKSSAWIRRGGYLTALACGSTGW